MNLSKLKSSQIRVTFPLTLLINSLAESWSMPAQFSSLVVISIMISPKLYMSNRVEISFTSLNRYSGAMYPLNDINMWSTISINGCAKKTYVHLY